jgi:hypothetical protein
LRGIRAGKWSLEIHNDAYSTWLSDAKFFRWSLKLYGTQSDPNSDNAEGRTVRNFFSNSYLAIEKSQEAFFKDSKHLTFNV